MEQVVSTIAEDLNLWLAALALAISVSVSSVIVRFVERLRRASAGQRLRRLALAGAISGATIWTAHFVAMVGHQPTVERAFEPALTFASLLAAVVGVTIALALATVSRTRAQVALSGALFGLAIAATQYVGALSIRVPAHIFWDHAWLAGAALCGAGFGAAATWATADPRWRYSRAVGIAAMASAITLTHFIAMAAMRIEPDPSIAIPPQLLSGATLSALVVTVMVLCILVMLTAYLLEGEFDRQVSEAFENAALRDPLTNLPNRAQLTQRLDAFADQIARGDVRRLAVLTIDLNRFKEINDMHGHNAGDAVLKTLAARLWLSTGSKEFIARTGGDEFVAVKFNYGEAGDVDAFARRLIASIVEPIAVGDLELAVGASVGIAAYPEHGDDLHVLRDRSDMAMYRAKDGYADQICVFDEEMDQQSRERLALAYDLRIALQQEQFELDFQRQNDAETRETIGFEALLRWDHPTRGRIAPADFIPLAEKTGLIRPIGLWVLRTACMEAASWPRPHSIAVNVAPQQLAHPDFVEAVADVLTESGLDPQRLELEITEASLIDDHQNTLSVMQRLRRMGIRIAMDDFGTGYSSLASLREFPFDKIKIDRSFVTQVHNNEQSAAIVRSTLLLGGALKIPVLAEGVETEEELGFLGAERCVAVQGFLFGQPMPAAEVRRRLHEEADVAETSPEASQSEEPAEGGGSERAPDAPRKTG